jgi:uncharacterized protein (TIGR01777 family)
MKVVVSGSSGLVGSTLGQRLKAEGHEPVRLVRRASGCAEPEIVYDIAARSLAPEALQGVDAIIHLAGENVAGGRWTAKRRAAIRSSRIDSTATITKAVATLDSPPPTLISASAVGFYGHRGDDILTESSARGEGFLADVCAEWEAASVPALELGMRVVNLRFGMILSAQGGALAKMVTPFKLGLGGVVGSGTQWMSWITLDDAVAAILFALSNSSLSGPINIVSPQPVTNRAFTKSLAEAVHRTAFCPLPAPMVRLIFGEMGRDLLLSSTRAIPEALEAQGFEFAYGDLSSALAHALRPGR